ncbi:hypothetical protein AB0C96_09115 [Streptomyces sp. NPDC048506]|uniref:hypothetical protein n=1 Tax=Streptomyces sp. NPDC048506 TaxID=3155028 RepID=UPI003444AD2E
MTLLYGASVSGKPHLVTVTVWPADPEQLVLTRCGRLSLREIPEPAPGHLCGSCQRLRACDQHQEAAARRHHQRHLEPVCRRIADEINRLRAGLLADIALPAHLAMTPARRSEQSAIVTGLLAALSIALGTPGNDDSAELYAQQHASS